jgi:hypothetical protein
MTLISAVKRILYDHLLPTHDLPVHTCFFHPQNTDISNNNNSSSTVNSSHIRLLTLNVWGLPIAAHCHDRCQSLIQLFQRYDIIALQEALHLRELHIIIDYAKQCGITHQCLGMQGIGFPTYRDVVGSGLVILSRISTIQNKWQGTEISTL